MNFLDISNPSFRALFKLVATVRTLRSALRFLVIDPLGYSAPRALVAKLCSQRFLLFCCLWLLINLSPFVTFQINFIRLSCYVVCFIPLSANRHTRNNVFLKS